MGQELREVTLEYPHGITVMGKTIKGADELPDEKFKNKVAFQFGEWLLKKEVSGILVVSAVSEMYKGKDEWEKMAKVKKNWFTIPHDKALEILQSFESKKITLRNLI